MERATSCKLCGSSFGLFRHRHTCRLCQDQICHDCSKVVVDEADSSHRVRLCTKCLTQREDGTPERAAPTASTPTPSSAPPATAAARARPPVARARSLKDVAHTAAKPRLAEVPPALLRREAAGGDAVCTGDSLLLFADPDQVMLTCRGFSHDQCEGVPPASTHIPFQALTVAAVVVADSDRADDRLYSFDVDTMPTLENAAAMSPSLQAILSPRVDLALQKMAQWPRLLASRIERRGLRGLHELELEQLMLETIRMDPNILSMAVAFEPGMFYKTEGATEPESVYAHFAEWAKPSQGAQEPETPGGMLTSANTAPTDHTNHGKDATADRVADCPVTSSICYGDVTFAELLPPTYTPLYREWKWYQTPKKIGQATWTDPYLDDGGANVPMVTYSVPIRQDGVFAGVATMDVVLDPASTQGLTQAVTDASAESDEQEEEEDDGAAEAASRARLEAMAMGPRRAANSLGDMYDSQGTVDDLFVRTCLKTIVNSDKQVFGSCVAFMEGVFDGAPRCSFYACRDDGEEPAATTAGADAAGAGAALEGNVVEDGLRFQPLDYDYTTEEWFRVPIDERKEYWSQPYYDDGGGNIWMITYSVPFKKGGKFAGVVTLDIPFTQSLKAVFMASGDRAHALECSNCGMPCKHSYRTVVGHVGSNLLCDRCTADGLLPAGATLSDLRLTTDDRYREWWSHTRRPGTAIRFGQAIQLAHSGTGEFLSTRLTKRSSLRSSAHTEANQGLYRLALDTGMPDPYVEGSPDSWFVVLPGSPGHCLGELVRFGDDICLVSRRWQWVATVPRPPSSIAFKSAQHHLEHTIRSWRVVDFARWSENLAAGAVTIPIGREVPDSSASRRVFELRDDDGDGSATVVPLVSAASAQAVSTSDTTGQSVVCGSPLVMLSLQDGSVMHATRQLELLDEHLGVDCVQFSRPATATDSDAPLGIAPSTVPTAVRGGDVWVPQFTAGGGGPAKWGTLFHLYNPSTEQYLAFPPDQQANPADVAFVLPAMVTDRADATPFFWVRGSATVDEVDELSADHVHFGTAVRMACRINKRSWWLGVPDDGGRLGARALGRLPLDAEQMAADASIGRVWLWDQRDAAMQCTLRPVSRSFLRDIRRSVSCIGDLKAIAHRTRVTPEEATPLTPSPVASKPAVSKWMRAAQAYRSMHGTEEHEPDTVLEPRTPLDKLDSVGVLERTAELLLHLALFVRGQRVDNATLHKVVDACIVSSQLAVLPDQPVSASGFDWSGLMSTSSKNTRVVADHQALLHDCRAIEVVFATMESLLKAVDPSRDAVSSHVATRVVALCLRFLSLLVARSTPSCVVAALRLPLLCQIVARDGIGLPPTSPEMSELSRLAAGLLQEIIRRYRPVVGQVTTASLDAIIDIALRTNPLPATLVALLCGLVARPVAHTAEFAMHFDSLAEEQVVLDCLGAGQLVCFNTNQWHVATKFLMANNSAILQRFQVDSPLWGAMHIRAEAASTTEGFSVVTDAQTEFGEKSVLDGDGGAPSTSKRLSLGAAEAILRLCCCVCRGALGAVVRQSLIEHAGFTWPRLVDLIFDDKYPFRLRAQLAHLLRVMYVSPQLVPPEPPMEGGASFVAASLAGSVTGAASVAAASAADASARGLPVSVPNLAKEVPWGLGLVGATVCVEPNQGLSWLGDTPGDDSASMDDAIVEPGGISLASNGHAESKAEDLVADDVFDEHGSVPTMTREAVETAVDCELPRIDHRDADALLAIVAPYLERCLALRKKHVLTLAVLKLSHSMIERGVWAEAASAQLVPHLVAILAEEDSFTAVEDDDWAVGYRRLLRAKLLASTILHTMLTLASHEVTVHLLQAAKSDHFSADAASGVAMMSSGAGFVRAATSRGGASGALLRRGLSGPAADILADCGPMLSGVLRRELEAWHAMHSMFELGEKESSELGSARKSVSLPLALLNTLVSSDFSPLLRSLAFLLVRLHDGPSEVSVNVATVCLLRDPVEEAFARHAHAVVQTVRALTTHERSLEHADELSTVRLEAISRRVSRLLRALRFGLQFGTFTNLTDDDLVPGSRLDAPNPDDLGADTVPPARGAHVFHTLAVTQTCVELIGIPLQSVAAALSEPLTQWRTRGLRAHSLDIDPESHPLLRILREAYALLTAIATDHAPTRVPLRKHLNFFMDHTAYKLQSMDLVQVLVSGSQEAAADVHAHHISAVISRLKDPTASNRIRRVQFLKSLVCVEDGKLVTSNQMVILRSLCEQPAVLGLLNKLDDVEQLRRFVSIADNDTDRAPASGEAKPGSDASESKAAAGDDFTPDLARRAHDCSSEASFFISMLDLLTVCCPNKLVYRDGLATRESEEAALLVQAAIPLKGVVSALLSVNNFYVKAVLLRFLEQIWGALALAVTPATNVLDLTPVPRMTSRPATATSPIAIHLLEDFCVAVDAYLGPGRRGTVIDVNLEAKSAPVPVATTGLSKYLFGAVFPFLVGYFHSAFRRTLADNKAVIPIADTLFRRLIRVANAVTSKSKSVSGVEADALMNCIINLHDPEGCLRCSGVNGGLSDEHVLSIVDALRTRTQVPAEAFSSPVPAWLLEDDMQRFPWLSGLLKVLERGATPGQGVRGTKHSNGHPHARHSHGHHHVSDTVGSSKLSPVMPDACMTLADMEFEPLVHVVADHPSMLKKLLLLMTEIADRAASSGLHPAVGGSESSMVADDGVPSEGTILPESSHASPQTLAGVDPSDPAAAPEVLLLPFLRVFSRLAKSFDGEINRTGQQVLVNVGAPRLIVRLMGWSFRQSNSAVMLQCLELAHAVLDGGYRPAQDAILREMRASSETSFLPALDSVVAGMDLHILTVAEHEAALLHGSNAQYQRQLASAQALKLSLSVMQQLCEGHYTAWQDLLREQPGAIADVDVITKVVSLLARLTCSSGSLWYVLVYWTSWYEPQSIVTAVTGLVQLYDTLTEVMQGPCEGNQVLLSTSQVFDSVVSIWGALQTVYVHKANEDDFGAWGPLSAIATEDAEGVDDELFSQPRGALLLFLQDTILSTLSAMLEGGDGGSAARMVRRLELQRLPALLANILPAAIEAKHRPPGQEELTLDMDRARLSDGVWDARFSELDLCANYVSFFKQLAIGVGMRADLQPEPLALESTVTRPLAEMLQHPTIKQLVREFGGHVAQVEVLRDDSLRTLVFRVPPSIVRHQRDSDIREIKDRIIFFVKRDNPYAKIDDFVRLTSAQGQSGSMMSALLSNPALKHMPIVRAVPKLLTATFVLAIILNILLLVCESNVTDGGDRRTVLEPGAGEWKLDWTWETGDSQWTCRLIFILGIVHALLSICRLVGFYILQSPKWLGHTGFEDLGSSGNDHGDGDEQGGNGHDHSHKHTKGVVVTDVVWKALTEPVALYMLLYTVASILGVFEPLLFGFHLFDLLIQSSLLKETLSALGQYGGSLAATGLLWLLTMYVFALIGDAAFAEDFGAECTTLLDCVSFTLNFGMRAGGGLGDVITGGVDGEDGPASIGFERMLFDIAFFVIVNVIMIAIVSGTVIDSFGAQRDRRNEVNDDQQTKCFICSQETSKFERLGRGFQYHVRHQHNMWHYVYMVAYLALKEETSYTGLESHVAQRLRQHSLDVYPIGRAIVSSARG